MRIDAVQLSSPDPASYAEFYARVLDLPVRRLTTGGVAGPDLDSVEIRCGATTLSVARGRPQRGVDHLAFGVPNDAFDAARAWLLRRVPLMAVGGVDVFAGPGHWDSRSVYFAGPDGSVLELIARRPLPDRELLEAAGVASSADLPGSAVAAVSEVGIAASDLPGVRAALSSVGVEPFGEGAPGFAPAGDHDGLLILVSPGRTWMPTDDLTSAPRAVRLELHAGPRRFTLRSSDEGEIAVVPRGTHTDSDV